MNNLIEDLIIELITYYNPECNLQFLNKKFYEIFKKHKRFIKNNNFGEYYFHKTIKNCYINYNDYNTYDTYDYKLIEQLQLKQKNTREIHLPNNDKIEQVHFDINTKHKFTLPKNKQIVTCIYIEIYNLHIINRIVLRIGGEDIYEFDEYTLNLKNSGNSDYICLISNAFIINPKNEDFELIFYTKFCKYYGKVNTNIRGYVGVYKTNLLETLKLQQSHRKNPCTPCTSYTSCTLYTSYNPYVNLDNNEINSFIIRYNYTSILKSTDTTIEFYWNEFHLGLIIGFIDKSIPISKLKAFSLNNTVSLTFITVNNPKSIMNKCGYMGFSNNTLFIPTRFSDKGIRDIFIEFKEHNIKDIFLIPVELNVIKNKEGNSKLLFEIPV